MFGHRNKLNPSPYNLHPGLSEPSAVELITCRASCRPFQASDHGILRTFPSGGSLSLARFNITTKLTGARDKTPGQSLHRALRCISQKSAPASQSQVDQPLSGCADTVWTDSPLEIHENVP